MLDQSANGILIEAAARHLIAAIVARARGDEQRVSEARERILNIASIVGSPFLPMLIGKVALALMQRAPTKTTSAPRFEQAEAAVRVDVERLLPELGSAAAYRFVGTA
jgi:hypothetical protein